MATNARIARTEFSSALNQLAHERGIDPAVILDSIKTALVAAFRKDYPDQFKEEWIYEVEIDQVSGESRIFGAPSPESEDTTPRQDVTPPGFGRIAAQTAKQVILQKIREAEKNAVLAEYEKRLHTLVTGMVLRFEGPNVVVDIGKSEAIMPPQEKIPTENYHINQRLTFYLEDIRETMRGREIIVSRANKGLVEGLFRREVPEVANASVEIKCIAREPGSRTKIAVASSVAGVDPVGSCVGQKGVRVQAIINEMAGEKVDIVQWHEDPLKFIANSLSPAQGIDVVVTSTKKLIAKAIVPDDQLSLAIGRDGQNVRLAAKLTGYKIDVVGQQQTAIARAKSEAKKPETAEAAKTQPETDKKGDRGVVTDAPKAKEEGKDAEKETPKKTKKKTAGEKVEVVKKKKTIAKESDQDIAATTAKNQPEEESSGTQKNTQELTKPGTEITPPADSAEATQK